MDRFALIHIGTEVVVITTITYYFYLQNVGLQKQIDELKRKTTASAVYVNNTNKQISNALMQLSSRLDELERRQEESEYTLHRNSSQPPRSQPGRTQKPPQPRQPPRGRNPPAKTVSHDPQPPRSSHSQPGPPSSRLKEFARTPFPEPAPQQTGLRHRRTETRREVGEDSHQTQEAEAQDSQAAHESHEEEEPVDEEAREDAEIEQSLDEVPRIRSARELGTAEKAKLLMRQRETDS